MIKNERWFTLIETILYVAIIGMTVGAFIAFILMIVGLRNKFHAIEEVQANERAVKEIVYHYIRNAKSIMTPVKGNTADSLVFVPAESLSVHSFSVQNGQLILDNGSATTSLTSNEVVISDVSFVNMGSVGSPDVLQVSGTMKSFSSSSIEYMHEDNFRYYVSLPK